MDILGSFDSGLNQAGCCQMECAHQWLSMVVDGCIIHLVVVE